MKLIITVDVHTDDNEVGESGNDKRQVVMDAVKEGRFQIKYTLVDE